MFEARTISQAQPRVRPKRQAHNLFLLAVGLAVLSSVAFQGSRGLYESTEGRYAQCARETLQAGVFLEPILNGENHWAKPPLTYIAIAAGLTCFGNNAWGARAYLVVCFVLTVVSVYCIGLRLWGKPAAAYSALVYATSPFTVGAANAVSTDTLLVLWQSLSVAFFWFAIRREKTVCILCMWVALGLAFLTKGPVGLLPLGGIVPAYFLLRRKGVSIPRLLNVSSLIAFIFIGLGWYLLEIVRHPFLLEHWVMHETIGRFTTNEFQRNSEFSKIFTLYFPVLLFGTGPWVFLLLIKRKQTGLSKQRLVRWRDWEDQVQWLYLLAAFFVPLLILLLSKSRLPLYVLPLFTPLALAMGKWLSRLVANGHVKAKAIVITACCCSMLLVALKGASAYYPSRNNMAQLADSIRPILDERPNSPLILLCKNPLNGLEFYLERQIPVPPFPEPGRAADNNLRNSAVLVPGTLVLTRAKYLRYAGNYLPRDFMETEFRNGFWALGVVKRPLDLWPLAQQAGIGGQRTPH